MDKLNIYIQVNFLSSFFEYLRKPLIELKNAELILFVQHIIKRTGSFYIDLSHDSISKLLVDSEENNRRYSKDFITFFRNLAQEVYIKESPYDLETPENLLLLDDKSKLPHYLLLDCEDNEAIRYEKMMGIICISKYLQANRQTYCLNVESFQKNVTVNVNRYMKTVSQSHSVIIEDPYIYNIDLQFLENLLLSFFNNNFKNNPLHILLVGQNLYAFNKRTRPSEIDDFIKYTQDLERFINEFNIKFSGNIIVELALIGGAKLHDRHILSNSFWIVSGHSFKEKYNTNTEWQSRPVGIYFKQFRERIDFINAVIKRNYYNSRQFFYKNKPIKFNRENILIH